MLAKIRERCLKKTHRFHKVAQIILKKHFPGSKMQTHLNWRERSGQGGGRGGGGGGRWNQLLTQTKESKNSQTLTDWNVNFLDMISQVFSY